MADRMPGKLKVPPSQKQLDELRALLVKAAGSVDVQRNAMAADVLRAMSEARYVALKRKGAGWVNGRVVKLDRDSGVTCSLVLVMESGEQVRLADVLELSVLEAE